MVLNVFLAMMYFMNGEITTPEHPEPMYIMLKTILYH
jgi:hypothetical protein